MENQEAKKEGIYLLEIMIKTGLYFGFKKVLDGFSRDSRRKIMEVVADIDKNFEEKINRPSEKDDTD